MGREKNTESAMTTTTPTVDARPARAKRMVLAKNSMANSPMITCPMSERTIALCSIAKPNPNVAIRKPVRCVMASRFLRVRTRHRKIAPPSNKALRR